MRSQIYRIRINKCDNPGFWYSKYIGNTFYAGAINKRGATYFIIISDKLNNDKLVNILDASVLERITKVKLY